jgi:hypothetical protein
MPPNEEHQNTNNKGVDKLDFLKIQKFFTSKETIMKVKRQFIGENICE